MKAHSPKTESTAFVEVEEDTILDVRAAPKGGGGNCERRSMAQSKMKDDRDKLVSPL